jgi:hypothetical protein
MADSSPLIDQIEKWAERLGDLEYAAPIVAEMEAVVADYRADNPPEEEEDDAT